MPVKVVSIIEGYKYTQSDPKTGREKLRMLAAKDTAYEDGRHELEKVDMTASTSREAGIYASSPIAGVICATRARSRSRATSK